jgi:hypothetical protein
MCSGVVKVSGLWNAVGRTATRKRRSPRRRGSSGYLTRQRTLCWSGRCCRLHEFVDVMVSLTPRLLYPRYIMDWNPNRLSRQKMNLQHLKSCKNILVRFAWPRSCWTLNVLILTKKVVSKDCSSPSKPLAQRPIVISQKTCRESSRGATARNAPIKLTLRSSLFWDVTQRWLLVTDVSGQPIGSVFKGRAFGDRPLHTAELPCNIHQ